MSLGDLKDALVRCGAVRRGHFTLTSGRESDYYIDIKRASTQPAILGEIAHQMASLTRGADRLAGMEFGAVPIVVALSMETGIPFVIVRKRMRGHGAGQRVEGDIREGETMIIVEDVTTTGGTILEVARVLRALGIRVDRALTVVDREEGAKEMLSDHGVALVPLVSAKELLG